MEPKKKQNNTLFGLWEETLVHKCGENLWTPDKKAPAKIWTRNVLAVKQQW